MRTTYEQKKEIYNKFRRERRMKVTATLLVWTLVCSMGFFALSCSTPTESEMNLRNEWREIYDNVSYPHTPHTFNIPVTEVEILNYELKGTGITAFRIDPNNPEHQRRYRRHLEEPVGFRTVETDI